MEINNTFRVAVAPEAAWRLLTDVERIAPCLPGAQLEQAIGDEYHGNVKVKLGPVTMQYKGTARFTEKDDEAMRGVLVAQAREARGQGTANATIRASLRPDGDGSRVDVVTDLAITGKAAQFGRGMIAEVSERLLGQFAQNLEAMIAADSDRSAGAPTDARTPQDVAPVDLLDAAGASVAKRLLPALGAVAVIILAITAWRRRAH